ncbi:glutamine--tRNA ligase [Buchnera aphidicola (Formosaphis micheliae)]|uniref:glutamine--tRNA ligase n=1 Tax=Buchnera aphidicola TaxID=9 RepID=UPI0031CC8F62
MKKDNYKQTNFIKHIIEKDLKNKLISVIKTRFPPEPNGYLHIGHAKSICLNFGLATEYHGTCNLRFDDTNPMKENIEYINSIKNDIKWLGFKWNNDVKFSSMYFDKIYKYAIELINNGLAYVDLLNQEEIRKYRGTLKKPGINSPYRNQSIEKNLLLFKQMKNGFFSTGEACLRAKINMCSPFIIMRDPVLYRIIFYEHHQTKNTWCIYPTYDFAHCISDALEGITHSICTLEFQDNRRLYDWILNKINIKYRAYQYEYSRLNIEYTILSKRKLNILVKKNIVTGWDDPRMPTISGLRRRGYTPSSIRTFCDKIGVTKQDNLIEMSLLESCIKNDLNTNAPRAMAILDPIKIRITNLPTNYLEILMVPNHPNQPNMGYRSVYFTNELYIDRSDFYEQEIIEHNGLILGKEIRLRYSYIIQAQKIKKDKYKNIVEIQCIYDKETLGKHPKNRKVKGVIHWLSTKNTRPAIFNLYDKLFNIKNPEKEINFLQHINTESLIIKKGFIELNLLTTNISNVYQFERIGYFCFDKQINNTIATFNRIISLNINKTKKK